MIGDNDCRNGIENVAADKIYGFIARRGLLCTICVYSRYKIF